MSEVVFARTRHEYDSYADFWSLVTLSEYPICFVDEIRLDTDAVYILTPVNGEMRPHLQAERARVDAPSARVVWWNLERPDSGRWSLADIGVGASNDIDEIVQYVDTIWSSDRWFASLDPRMQFVPLGSHPGLATGQRLAAHYDWCHLSYATGRRENVYTQLRRLRLSEGPNGWGEARSIMLNSTRCMVNVHQTAAPMIEPLRVALTAAYRLPLVSETITDPYPLVAGKHFLNSDVAGIPALVRDLVANPGQCADLGQGLHHLLCVDFTFRRTVTAGAHAVR